MTNRDFDINTRTTYKQHKIKQEFFPNANVGQGASGFDLISSVLFQSPCT